MSLRPGRVRSLIALGVLVALVCVPSAAFGVRKIGLATGKFEFQVAAGQGGEGDIIVTNDGDEAIQVLVYAADQVVAEDGKLTFTVPGAGATEREGAATWLKLTIPDSDSVVGNVPYIDMQPGSNSTIHFTFTVPDDAPPGDHQAIVFFHIREASTEGDFSGAQTTITGRLGARITLHVEGAVIQQLSVRPFEIRDLIIGTKTPYTYVLRNDGNVDERSTVRLQMLGRGEEERFVTTLGEEVVTYAGTNLDQRGGVELDVPFGRYTARLLVEHPAQDGSGVMLTEIVERGVWVIPLWMAILAVVVLGAGLLWGSWRASVASARRSQAKAQARRRDRQERVRQLHEREAALAERKPWEE